jgi:hypothetical protein
LPRCSRTSPASSPRSLDSAGEQAPLQPPPQRLWAAPGGPKWVRGFIGAIVARRFQGWNDGCSLNQTAAYEANMVNLIKDIRKAWKKPALPVTIAASG